MLNVTVKYNEEDDDLFCTECKNRIMLGEKYASVLEEICDRRNITKDYHPECLPETEDEIDDTFINPT
jgi:hypothetical protein